MWLGRPFQATDEEAWMLAAFLLLSNERMLAIRRGGLPLPCLPRIIYDARNIALVEAGLHAPVSARVTSARGN